MSSPAELAATVKMIQNSMIGIIAFAVAVLFALYLAAMLGSDDQLAALGQRFANEDGLSPVHPLDWLWNGDFNPSIQTISLLMLACFVVLIIGIGMPIEIGRAHV